MRAALHILLGAVLALGLGQGEVPCVRHAEAPAYPGIAWSAQIQGDVAVTVRIGSDGRVRSARATSGPPVLRKQAEENAAKWTFVPRSATQLEIVYQFRLHKPDTDYGPFPEVKFDFPNRFLVESRGPKPMIGSREAIRAGVSLARAAHDSRQELGRKRK